MTVSPCNACGHQIATTALACPNCGAPGPGHHTAQKQRQGLARPFLVLGFAIAAFGMVAQCGLGEPGGVFAVVFGLALFVVGRIVSGHKG